MYEKWKKKKRKSIETGISGDGDDGRPSPNFKHNSKLSSELRDTQAIKKIRQERDRNKLKNMKKSKRKAIVSKKKQN
jgi:hypothetical protein